MACYAKGLEFESQHIHCILSTLVLIYSLFRIINYKFYIEFDIPAKMYRTKEIMHNKETQTGMIW